MIKLDTPLVAGMTSALSAPLLEGHARAPSTAPRAARQPMVAPGAKTKIPAAGQSLLSSLAVSAFSFALSIALLVETATR